MSVRNGNFRRQEAGYQRAGEEAHGLHDKQPVHRPRTGSTMSWRSPARASHGRKGRRSGNLPQETMRGGIERSIEAKGDRQEDQYRKHEQESNNRLSSDSEPGPEGDNASFGTMHACRWQDKRFSRKR